MTIKCEILFESANPVAGWSEIYYYPGTSLSVITSALASLITLRLAILPTDTSIVGTRAYVIGAKRNGITTVFSPPQAGTWTSGDKSTEPWSALLFAKSSNYQVTINSYLHAIPQSQVVEGVFTPTTGFTTALAAFASGLIATWVLYAVNPATGGSKTTWPITLCQPKRLVSHRVGRPFGLLVGRRLVRT